MPTKPWREIRNRKLSPPGIRRADAAVKTELEVIDGVRRWWNYRIVRHEKGTPREWMALHEVHYENGKPVGIAENPATFVSDLSVSDLRGSLERALTDSKKRRSILDFENFAKPRT